MADASAPSKGETTEEIGRRHDVPPDAVATMVDAIRRGGGRQAQFSHPALGGMGQWSRGGGIMIGDMFNHALKAKIDRLCGELADSLDADEAFGMNAGGSVDWWPSAFGRPSSNGSQNGEAYACFPDTRRLALRNAEGIRIYDTGEHRITGVSQQQGDSRDLRFSGPDGVVALSDLRRLSDEDHGTGRGTAPPTPAPTGSRDSHGDILGLLERLYELQRKGILTAEEFAAKKAELLGRL